MSFKQTLKRNLISIPGWRTNRHIVVIESDDWGSIRMPSLEVYDNLISNGVKLGKYGYEKVDTIASRDDLEHLFDVCDLFRDINDRPVVITANAVVANPDFEKIKASYYQEYFFEPITTTMERYYPGESPFSLWKEGMDKMVFHPQLHGREHINVPMWLNSLRENHPGAREAFDKGVFSFVVDKSIDKREKNTSSYYYLNEEEFQFDKQSIIEAASLFERLFGYRSESFIAPSYKWDERIEDVLHTVGIKYIQGMYQHFYNGKRKFNFVGSKNHNGQIFLNRNANFEYSQNQSIDWVYDTLKNAETAFKWHKPLVINSHRLNFVGALNLKNRDENLIRLKTLITEIQKRWPDVEFLTSDELGRTIEKKKKS